MSGADFGKANAGNGELNDDAVTIADDASEKDVEALNEKLREERIARKKLERELTELRETVENLKEEVENDTSDGEQDLSEIEWRARNKDYGDMWANTERAVKIWEECPNHAKLRRGKHLTLSYESLKKAIAVVDGKPKKKVDSETVRRVRDNLEELGDGLVKIKEMPGKKTKKHKRTVVDVEEWSQERPEVVVKNLLPEKTAEAALSGGKNG